jgi:hypothetical protein
MCPPAWECGLRRLTFPILADRSRDFIIKLFCSFVLLFFCSFVLVFSAEREAAKDAMSSHGKPGGDVRA